MHACVCVCVWRKTDATHRLRSASCGSVPGSDTVMVVGALTSYLRCGFLQMRIRTRKLNMVLDMTPMKGCVVSGKNLQQKHEIK